VRPQEQDASLAGWVNPTLPRRTIPLEFITSFFDKTLIIAELEARKLRHDPTELITRAVQPTL